MAIASGASRKEAVANALGLVRDDIIARVKGRVLIKPNFLSSTHHLSSTMPDAVRPILELLKESNATTLCIAEGGSRSTVQALDNFGYRAFADEFGAEFIDINHGDFPKSFETVTTKGGTQTVEYADLSTLADTIISVPVAKTHDSAIVTLSVKNMMGCLRRVHRPRMHGIGINNGLSKVAEIMWNMVEGHPLVLKSFSGAVFSVAKHFRSKDGGHHTSLFSGVEGQVAALAENVCRMGHVLMPDIAVIDAFEAMEGDGPGSAGTQLDMGLAVAGVDPLACDAVMCSLMGFDPMETGHIRLLHDCGLGCADMSMIDCVGESLGTLQKSFKPHRNYPQQKRWREVREAIFSC